MLNTALSNSSQDVFRQDTYITNRPGLEITPISFNGTNKESSNLPVPSKALSNALHSKSKSHLSKDQIELQQLLVQLPALKDYFQVHKKIGEGTYSSVYLASYKDASNPQKFAVKHLTQNFSWSKIQKELKFMQMIGGQDNVVNVFNCIKSVNEDCAVFVMPYMKHRKFSEYVLNFDTDELRLYMKNLLIALRRVHAFNVIHRDVKPGNFLYNRENKQFLLVDFGLAQQVDAMRRTKHSTTSRSDNMPIDYSKRRGSPTNDVTPAAKFTALSPLKSRENINSDGLKRGFDVTPPLPTTNELQRGNVERTPLKTKSQTSSSGKSSSSRKKLFTDESTPTSGTNSSKSLRRVTSLGTSLLKSKTENKLASTPNDRSVSKDQRSFTPLVANKTLSGSFVQVRNSQVVAEKQTLCGCLGAGVICKHCQGKRVLAAPRAGTPGFRPPEVLLKHFHQTTAVDMWAAGVVMLCILSGCYPFFKAPTDLAALLEIITIFGNSAVSKVATKFGRRIVISRNRKPVDLRQLCRRLRARRVKAKKDKPVVGNERCEDCLQSITEIGCLCSKDEIKPLNHCSNNDVFPDSAYHLLLRLLDLDPSTRITAEEALNHPFITQQ